MKKLICILGSICFGFLIGYFIPFTSVFSYLEQIKTNFVYPVPNILSTKTVIGFLPYWLTYRASLDYSKYITDLTYFDLTINKDGSILKLATATQEDPGWNALSSGRLTSFFKSAKKHHVSLSLLLFSGNINTIKSLMSHPVSHANTLVSQVSPILADYGFSDLNLDIEYTGQSSSLLTSSFTRFIKQIRSKLNSDISLTVEISTTDVIRKDMIDPASIAGIADKIVLMAYDYHSPSSYVTGPVAPLFGAGIISEYDVQAAVDEALKVIPVNKLILGIPLYGYQWEALNSLPRSADIPGSGVVASNRRAEAFMASCATCSATMNNLSKETYTSYYDWTNGVYDQIFYPTKLSTASKLNFANQMNLSGVAFWALGYEGRNILQPVEDYKKELNFF